MGIILPHLSSCEVAPGWLYPLTKGPSSHQSSSFLLWVLENCLFPLPLGLGVVTVPLSTVQFPVSLSPAYIFVNDPDELLFPTWTLNDIDIICDSSKEFKVTRNKPNKKRHKIFIEKITKQKIFIKTF